MGLRDKLRRHFGLDGTISLDRYVSTASGIVPLRPLLNKEDLLGRLQAAGATGWRVSDQQAFLSMAREAAEQVLGERPFEHQVVGALALLDGRLVQMATGEGKTLACAIAAAGYALQGRQVHVLSVNDYLAERDAEWMAPFYRTLGVTVGWVSEGMNRQQRLDAYACQVTYVSVNELGFDVLRDRFLTDPSEESLFVTDIAIVDEADAVLVDEATTPLVLAGSGAAGQPQTQAARIVASLIDGVHFVVDPDARNVALTDEGVDQVESLLGDINLFGSSHGHLSTINVALHAHALLHRDVDYLVRDGRIELINASRGRVAHLQRWPDGLHAAVEAKEKLRTSMVSEILDSITVQGVLNEYQRVCGTSGTVLPVAEQLAERFDLRTGILDTRLPVRRVDIPDRVSATRNHALQAALDYIAQEHATGRPILIGTGSVAESESIAADLVRAGLDVTVLNAKNDSEEAAIIARAGEYGRITISTQIAGRGTDILLGGLQGASRDEIIGLGGLCVVGLGRHENRRLDDQLRGRAGRQGDPGTSVFFCSFQDDLVTRNAPGFAPATFKALSSDFNPETAAELINHAQRISEGSQQEKLRNTLSYADVPSAQRAAVLRLRTETLRNTPPECLYTEKANRALARLAETVSGPTLARAHRSIVLFHLDARWSRHLESLAEAREGIHLRSLARDTPLNEYNKLAYREFDQYMTDVRDAIADTLEHAADTDNLDVNALELIRPSATWTYMVVEDPFGSPEQRFGNLILNRLRRKSSNAGTP